MEGVPLHQQPADLFARMRQLVGERQARERQIEQAFQRSQKEIEAEYQKAKSARAARHDAEEQATQREYERVRQEITDRFEGDLARTQAEYDGAVQEIERHFAEEWEKAQEARRDARWEVTTLTEVSRTAARDRYQKVHQQATASLERIGSIRDAANGLVQQYRQGYLASQPPDPGSADFEPDEPFAFVDEEIDVAARQLERLRRQRAPRLLKGERLGGVYCGLWALVVLIAWLVIRSSLAAQVPPPNAVVVGGMGFVAGTLVFVVLALVGRVALFAWVRHVTRRDFLPLAAARARAQRIAQNVLDRETEQYRQEVASIRSQRARTNRQADATYRLRRTQLFRDRDKQLDGIHAIHPGRLEAIRQRRAQESQAADAEYPARLAAIEQRFQQESLAIEQRHARRVEESQSLREAQWQELTSFWQQGLESLGTRAAELGSAARALFPPWDADSWAAWTPRKAPAPAVRFGQLELDLARLAGGVPQAERLRDRGPGRFLVPALLEFPDRCSLVVRASGEGRTAAEDLLQLTMLRFLIAAPASKVRFVIVDPIGLGQNFSAFMHLADFDEALVTNRIWTEPGHIEQRLTNLTEHMETVIQKYLRNQFESIADYNVQAGEVAEPYRVLVVVNFPANFTDGAVRRLLSIAQSGVRCGIHLLLSVDARLPLPQGIELADLERGSVTLAWQDGRFVWQGEPFDRLPVGIDPLPDTGTATRLLQKVGEEAKIAGRVEVPFAHIAPAEDQWWTRDSRGGIDVPLGRAGATKLQHLRLGHGTSQHALIAGKTGSGKSTLLHVLVTNLALLYSPEEVELYLVDFKKGVEFATYATRRLPHARVVAIESEREFGLSVLMRLDAELRRRGDLYREAGVQDVAAYRAATGQPLPRILLVVDEFQEFFVSDDKVAQEAALLLDRLVRQGRAFGMHVLLGSQTLGGAYTLARSTIGQMAVRVALQCSETDAHLILSDDNAAARLLSRPGEAIYNDANGLVEGNNPFQIVWLPDHERDGCLERLAALGQRREFRPPHPQIVFEGNRQADLAGNPALAALLASETWPTPPREPLAWLGDPIEIKEATAMAFRRQGGSNLLIVGQHTEAAHGILVAAMVGLASQFRPGSARFYVLDGTPPDAPRHGEFTRLAELLPHGVRVEGRRRLPEVLTEIADEVTQRLSTPDQEEPPVFLIIHELHRFRDLRRDEDEFGLSRSRDDEPPSPSRQLAQILKEGAGVGVHVLVWGDSLNDINRCFDRQSMREFDSSILFQMSAADSSALTDTSAAAKLGRNRALFLSEEEGKLEKFRPYALPSDAWCAHLAECFRRKEAAPLTR